MALTTVSFYQYTGDPRVANKSLGNAVHTTSTISPLETLSNLEMRLTVNYDDDIMTANYCEADGLYYKITDRKRGMAGSAEITARLDSVLSFWNQIKNCPSVCERSTTQYNGKINDPLYPVQQRRTIETKKLFELPNTDVQVLAYIE